jgi:hypothetical protein
MFKVTFLMEVCALFTGIIFFKKILPVIYRIMVFLILITVANESCSYFGLYRQLSLNKLFFYNPFILTQYLVICFIYLKSGIFKKNFVLLKIFVLLIGVISILLLDLDGFGKLSPNFISILSFVILFFAFYYLIKLYISNKVVGFRVEPLFWFSVGLVVSNLVLILFVNALRIENFNMSKESVTVFGYLISISNIFYYLCICYSFLCTSIYRKQVGI